MSARTQLQSKPVADLRSIAESLGIEHKGLQKAKLIDLLVEHGDENFRHPSRRRGRLSN